MNRHATTGETHPEEAARLMAAEVAMAEGWCSLLQSDAEPAARVHGGPAAWMCSIGLGHLCGGEGGTPPGIAEGFGLGLMRPER